MKSGFEDGIVFGQPGSPRRFIDVFNRLSVRPPPIWLMRQAGRYLPEYRDVRAKAGGFLDLCYSPELACEVTLQPIRRFGFDAAILFSDILVVPDALGQRVQFVEGEGPRLDPIRCEQDLKKLRLDKSNDTLAIVCQAVEKIRESLPNETALIGFCGAPWTVATYMVGGAGSVDQAEARRWAYRDPIGFRKLIELLTETSIAYLSSQVEAGVDALQIFDTWAGHLPDGEFESWVVEPTRLIVQALRARYSGIPIIAFPRGAGLRSLYFAAATGVDGMSCDTTVPVDFLIDLAEKGVVVQGNLDPIALLVGGAQLEQRAKQIVRAMDGLPFVFNLGHGILPQTPPEHVAQLVKVVRETSGA